MSPTAVGGAPPDPDLAGYRAIVGRYRSGDVDGAVQSIASWDRPRLLRVAREVGRLDESGRRQQGWDATDISAACLLHLEVLVRNPGRRALQVQAMREHLARLRRVQGLSATTAELHVGLAIYLQGQLALEDLGIFFDEIGRSAPSSGALLLAEATLHEVLASRRLEAARRAVLVPSADKSLDEAESLLRRALAAEPGLAEARLRLARVVLLRGSPDEAIALLQPVLERSTDADERYLADLFLGQALATAGRLELAGKAYAAAATECPCGQAASMGLAHLAFREGRLDTAREILTAALKPPLGCADPWAYYDFGQARNLAGLITELRRELRQ